jgi:ribonuclease BN (tRNA processing enzyme)
MTNNNMQPMMITTLGTSHGDHTYSRFNYSTLFETGNNAYLVDAGAPVEALLIRSGKQFKNLKAVFVTHMHNDHVGGLAGLVKAFIKYPQDGQYAQFYLPEEAGIEGLSGWLKAQHLPCPSDLYSLHTTTEGPVFSDDKLSVRAVRTHHFDFPSYAYILEADGKRIVHTGDLAADFSDFPEIVRDEPCDLCICESTHFNMKKALDVLRTCPIKKLIFTHVSNLWHGDGEKKLIALLKDMPFSCAIAHDGDTFSL